MFSIPFSYSQNCFPNGISFSSQNDLNLFPILYPNCTTIEGDVNIVGNDIISLDSLYNLEKILGDFIVTQTNLIDFRGLESLDTIDGSLFLIENNDNLVNFQGLNSLERIRNTSDPVQIEINIINNDNLVDFSGLDKLDDFQGAFNINDNPYMSSLNGLNNLSKIYSLSLFRNSNLTNLSGLISLDTITNELSIRFCNNLTTLNGLDNLKYLGELYIDHCNSITNLNSLINIKNTNSISLSFNSSLISLNGLDSIYSIHSDLLLYSNHALSNISAISNTDLYNLNALTVVQNPLLSICNHPSICSSINSNTITINISENDIGCNNVIELTNICCALDTVWCPPLATICFENGITFTSQSEINAFSSTYPNCKIIGGDVQFIGNDITSLDSLFRIEQILGDFAVINTNLINFYGLESLDSINGAHFRIVDNTTLIDFQGLNSVKSLTNDSSSYSYVYINNNSQLINFSGLDSLASINMNFEISDNDSLSTLSGLNSLHQIPFLYLVDNPNLVNLTGLSSVNTIHYLRITSCINLNSLNGLNNLEQVSILNIEFCPKLLNLSPLFKVRSLFDLNIYRNENLTSLAGLDSLNSIFSFSINQNWNLEDISAIANTDFSNTYNLTIQGNTKLAICNYPSICNYISDFSNHIILSENDVGCNGVLELTNACCANDTSWCPSMSDTCFESGILFNSQSEINAFPGAYPACKVIGSIDISGNDIIYLDSLYNIEKILGGLIVSRTNIENFNGLQSLDTILSEHFQVYENQNLINFQGLNSLKALYTPNTYYFDYPFFRIHDNNSLVDFSGLDSLKYIDTNAKINNNIALNSLNGLNNLNWIGSLNLTGNPSLQNLSGLSNLDSIGYDFNIFSCGLNSLEGLDDLHHLTNLGIFNCHNLTNLSSLGNIKALENLYISNNNQLTSLFGLDSINFITESIQVYDNANLNNLSAIAHADFSGINSLVILNNPELSVCSYSSICNYIENGTGDIMISDNSLGCNGQLEVERDCQGLLSIFEIPPTNYWINNAFYWHEASNWRNNEVPYNESYVIIPENTTCTIQADSLAICKEIILHPGATIDCKENSSLMINDED